MPANRVGGQIRIPRDRFEEWIGTSITAWPPVTDTDEVTAIAVNDTPTAFTSTAVTSTKPSRRPTTPTSPQLFSV